LRGGTSGWHYDSWRWPFFPKELPVKHQLTPANLRGRVQILFILKVGLDEQAQDRGKGAFGESALSSVASPLVWLTGF
jgi:hypothetical protein